MAQKFAAYGADGSITGFYDGVDSPAPSGASIIEITDAQWQACLGQPGYTVQSGALVAPTSAQLLVAAKAAQISMLGLACSTAITAGFQSNALGSQYTYPSTLTDQANQSSLSASSAGGSLWCESGSGMWAMVGHTQAQAQAVVASFASWLNSCQAQLVTLKGQVSAATTVAAVESITWVVP